MNFDDRIVKVVFTVGDEEITIDSSLNPSNPPFIAASGTMFADPTQNECQLQVGGLQRKLRNMLATNLTPNDYNQQRKSMEVWAGRVSTGLFLRYQGDIITGIVSQPPDTVMSFRSKTLQFFKHDVLAQSYAITAPMSQISADVAKSLGLNLRFEASDRMIGNYAYTGSAAGQVDKLGALGGMDAYVDNGTLVCKNKGVALKNTSFVLSPESGLIGQVEPTEWGVRCKSLLSQGIILGGTLVLDSSQNPDLNGSYTIYKTGFEIATRDTPFYDVIEATRYPAMFFNGIAPL
jgi:hypothetical protein